MFIRRGKHPHEVALLFATAAIGGFGIFAFGRSATSAARELAQPYGQLLYAGMAFSSVVALVGIFWPGITGALVERSGLIGVALLCLGQGAAAVYVHGFRALAFSLILAAFAIASMVRFVQIRREIREIITNHAFVVGGEKSRGTG